MAASVGKSAFITGGGSGIGRAVARHFAAQGWRIGVADINAAAAAETVALLPEGRASAFTMDVRDRDQWRACLESFTGGAGLDVLFNNAGISMGGPFADTGAADLERTIAINFTGVVHGAHIGYHYLRLSPGSCLLNTASAAGIYGTAGAAIYSATKFAVRGLTESLEAEWRREGIKVRSLMPSFIETPLLDGGIVGSNLNIRERVTSAGLELTPVEEVAEAAWRAVHGDDVHTVVGKTAKRMRFAARWMPKQLRRQASRGL